MSERLREPFQASELSDAHNVSEGASASLEASLARLEKIRAVLERFQPIEIRAIRDDLAWASEYGPEILSEADKLEKTATRVGWGRTHAGHRIPTLIRDELRKVQALAGRVLKAWDWDRKAPRSLNRLCELLKAISQPGELSRGEVPAAQVTLHGWHLVWAFFAAMVTFFAALWATSTMDGWLVDLPKSWEFFLRAASYGLFCLCAPAAAAGLAARMLKRTIGFVEVSSAGVVQWNIRRAPVTFSTEMLRGAHVFLISDGEEDFALRADRADDMWRFRTTQGPVFRALTAVIPESKGYLGSPGSANLLTVNGEEARSASLRG